LLEGVCPLAPDAKQTHSIAMRNRVRMRSILACDPAADHRFFGGHGVSGTGVSGPLPSAQDFKLSTTS
jgi:hypothetical protein